MTRAARRCFFTLMCVMTLSAGVLAQAPARGGFDFPDEQEDQPTWSDDVRAQALDIGLVIAFSTLAFISFFHKSRALKTVTLVASVE